MLHRIIQSLQLDQEDGLKTTPLYWDCECESNYLNYHTYKRCNRCGTRREDQPDSHINEVLHYLHGV